MCLPLCSALRLDRITYKKSKGTMTTNDEDHYQVRPPSSTHHDSTSPCHVR